MKLLVTGSRGFVGRGLLPFLAARGISGVATGRELPAGLPHGWQGAARGDVLGGDADAAAIDAIVHLEVKQHVPRPTAADEAEFELVNVGGTREWLAWAAARGMTLAACTTARQAVLWTPVHFRRLGPDMTAETIREFLRREPFKPLVIRMSNGESHQVRHPECLLVLKTEVILGYPEEDPAVHLALIHVNAVESLQAA